MKVTKIETEKDKYGVYLVTLTPNFIEKLFGFKERVDRFRMSDSTFVFGGGAIYTRQDGIQTGNGSYIGEAIDKWRRAF